MDLERDPFEPEPNLVVGWRFEELRRAGYDEREAMVLALRSDVDLHLAVRLAQKRCPRATAMRILT